VAPAFPAHTTIKPAGGPASACLPCILCCHPACHRCTNLPPASFCGRKTLGTWFMESWTFSPASCYCVPSQAIACLPPAAFSTRHLPCTHCAFHTLTSIPTTYTTCLSRRTYHHHSAGASFIYLYFRLWCPTLPPTTFHHHHTPPPPPPTTYLPFLTPASVPLPAASPAFPGSHTHPLSPTTPSISVLCPTNRPHYGRTWGQACLSPST